MRRARAEGAGGALGTASSVAGSDHRRFGPETPPSDGAACRGVAFRRTDRAGGGSAWRGSVGGPDRLGGGRFVDELQVADVAELPRIRFAWRRAVLEGRRA